ncbi:MAG: hypothetical protein ACKO21_12710, partial [Nodosilinea sp.]
MNALTQAAKLQQRLVSPLAPQPPALPAIRQKLIFAQQRLQDRHVPFQLAALSYLRLTCAAIQSAQRIGFRDLQRKIDPVGVWRSIDSAPIDHQESLSRSSENYSSRWIILCLEI